MIISQLVRRSHMNYLNVPKRSFAFDLLRIFAFFLVFLFHWNSKLFSFGYLGVDLFFLISGYLCAVTRPFQSFNSLSFIGKRMLRLLPSFIVFIALSLLTIPFLRYPISHYFTLLSSLIFSSNLYLAHSASDYFAASTQLNPFLHLWSISVEVQSYILFALTLFLCSFFERRKFYLSLIIFSLTCLSLISALIFKDSHYALQAYFLPLTRFWPIGLGMSHRFIQNNFSLLLFLLFSPLVFTLNHHLFLLYSLFYVSILYFDRSPLLPGRFSQSLIFFADIVYELYLAHWPVRVLLSQTLGGIGNNLLTFSLYAILSILIAACLKLISSSPLFSHV